MDKELKAKWVEALRSGTYQQGRDRLRNSSSGFCCLGVLLDISGLGKWETDTSYLLVDEGREKHVEGDLCSVGRNFFGLDRIKEEQLIRMNDGSARIGVEPHSFAEIADWIEANL